jgi:hypothetical protein
MTLTQGGNLRDNGNDTVIPKPSPQLGPIIRRRYHAVTVAYARLIEDWPDWEVRRDSTATLQELGWADERAQVCIAHLVELSQTLRRLWDIEANRAA